MDYRGHFEFLEWFFVLFAFVGQAFGWLLGTLVRYRGHTQQVAQRAHASSLASSSFAYSPDSFGSFDWEPPLPDPGSPLPAQLEPASPLTSTPTAGTATSTPITNSGSKKQHTPRGPYGSKLQWKIADDILNAHDHHLYPSHLKDHLTPIKPDGTMKNRDELATEIKGLKDLGTAGRTARRNLGVWSKEYTKQP